ncbi:MAG TPA: adenylyltransferase/cytidyltransferase family protein [Chlamydiales bacterium]|jgi:ethanolamine-phosphate cytidylyltransferase/choline-phosphate cytidylyltransferase|nr:adenylyltransferase/cytidyltransferase family protein [Chlamydiales bacterium]
MRKGMTILWCFAVCFGTLFAEEVSEQKSARVYVDIVGDLFHAGHIAFFKKAKAFGDYLIVGVLADEVVEEYKRTPVLTLEERVQAIEACSWVDEIIVAPPLRLTEEMVKEHKIDFVVHGDDFNKDLLEDQYGVALKLGIFRTVPYTKGISTSDIIDRIVSRYDEGEFHRQK